MPAGLVAAPSAIMSSTAVSGAATAGIASAGAGAAGAGILGPLGIAAGILGSLFGGGGQASPDVQNILTGGIDNRRNNTFVVGRNPTVTTSATAGGEPTAPIASPATTAGAIATLFPTLLIVSALAGGVYLVAKK